MGETQNIPKACFEAKKWFSLALFSSQNLVCQATRTDLSRFVPSLHVKRQFSWHPSSIYLPLARLLSSVRLGAARIGSARPLNCLESFKFVGWQLRDGCNTLNVVSAFGRLQFGAPASKFCRESSLLQLQSLLLFLCVCVCYELAVNLAKNNASQRFFVLLFLNGRDNHNLLCKLKQSLGAGLSKLFFATFFSMYLSVRESDAAVASCNLRAH